MLRVPRPPPSLRRRKAGPPRPAIMPSAAQAILEAARANGETEMDERVLKEMKMIVPSKLGVRVDVGRARQAVGVRGAVPFLRRDAGR